MDAAQLSSNNLFDYFCSVLGKINSRHREKVARLIDSQLPTADRISSAYSRLQEAQKAKRELTGFEAALARDAAKCLRNLDLRQLRLPFWWKYGVWVIIAAIGLAAGLAFTGYQWYASYKPIMQSTASHHSTEVQGLRGLAVQIGEAAAAAKEGNLGLPATNWSVFPIIWICLPVIWARSS